MKLKMGMGRFQGYQIADLRKDLISGFIVAVIAIPLGMAFAIASGVKPEYGIYTTVIAGILISLLGGSKYQIGGPTGAFIPILFAIVMKYGYESLLIAGFMAGILLVLMGLLRLGSLIAYIPRPVTVGFTAGIAVTIFSGQIPNFLGLDGIEKHEYFLSNMKEIAVNIGGINWASVVVALIGLAVLLVMPRLWPNMPSPIIALIISTLAGVWLFQGKVSTIGTAYGEIPSSLPKFAFPELTWDRIMMLWQPALIIAVLAAIESLLSAVVADTMTGTKHNSNRELIGQGVANIVTPMFGGIPATGAIARTAANIKSGAVSPLSGVFQGLIVLIVLLLFAPLASNIPLASMAPILMIVAWNMSGYRAFGYLLRTKTSDSIVLIATFLLTVFVNLTMAVGFGLILAVVFFVKHMGDSLRIHKVLPDHTLNHAKMAAHAVQETRDCPQIGIYTLEGPLFFGASQPYEEAIMKSLGGRMKVIFLRMSRVPFIDSSGEERLAELVRAIHKAGAKLIISGIQPQPLAMLQRTGLLDMIGVHNLFPRTGKALDDALASIDRQACIGCRHYAFRECRALSAGMEPEKPHRLQRTGNLGRPVGDPPAP